jgi:long-chain acyl-CoA synthetase
MATFPTNLGDLIDRSQDLNRLAIVDLRLPDAPREYTYADMERLSGGVARYLQSRDLPKGSRIAVAALNRAEYIAVYFGVMRAGHVIVPVNIKLPKDIIEFIVDDSSIRLAFADAAARDKLPSGLETIDFDDAGRNGFAALVKPSAFDTVTPGAGDLAQILYTSGSTGRPKGVLLSHAGQLWVLKAKTLPAEFAREHQVLAQPLFHMNGLIVTKCIFLGGASLVVMPSFNPVAYTEAMAKYKITSAFAIPTMFARVVKVLDERPDIDLSSIKQIVLASAPLTQALIDRVRAAVPTASVSNNPDGVPTPDLSVGYPVPGSEVRLVDGPDKDHGTLMMRNPAVMVGYQNLPEKTAQVIKDGWYISGDVMRRDKNGFFFFFGRADDMFVCSGENIYPLEVEKMLERHPAVAQASVVPLPDDERGQVPVAFIVPVAGARPTVDEIKKFAIDNGPAYNHPRRVEFRADLPLAGTNKIDRNMLTKRARELEAEKKWSP